jgi:hypothetical protein
VSRPAPGQPEKTLLRRVVRENLETMLTEARARTEHGFGYPSGGTGVSVGFGFGSGNGVDVGRGHGFGRSRESTAIIEFAEDLSVYATAAGARHLIIATFKASFTRRQETIE